ncbi:apicoplast pyruvate carrier 1-like [Babylonia areolata]|uniref:apicoplast pyruvate carrier 1-like n=1 Tax=Babylonia areolata TaxID=304850 RepID=UPI003FD5019F
MEDDNAKLLDETNPSRSSTTGYGSCSNTAHNEEATRVTSRAPEDLASCSAVVLAGRSRAEVENACDDGLLEGDRERSLDNKMAASEKGQNNRKWPPCRVVVTCVACFLVQFSLGVAYSSANMLPYLTSYLRLRTDASTGYAVTMWIGTGYTISGSVAMPFLGLLEKRLPPWGFRLLGIVLFCGSYLGASWAIRSSFVLTVVCLGVVQGCGQAVLYPACLNLPLQWLPERRGLVGGVIMAGFGGGGFLWDQVITAWINPHNLQAHLHVQEDWYFDQAQVLDRVPTCYLLLGGVLAALQLLCLLCMSYPPRVRADSDVRPSNVTAINATSESSSTSPANDDVLTTAARRNTDRDENSTGKSALLKSSSSSSSSSPSRSAARADADRLHDYSPLELLRSRTMWTITIFCFFTDLSLLIVFHFYKAYGQTFVHDDRLLSILASFTAVINAVSRPLWGWMADRRGFQPCLVTSQAFLAIGAALLLVSQYVGAAMFFFVVFLIFLAAGGIYGLEYTLVFLLFGSKNFTFNLGCLGFTGVFSSLIDVYVVETAKNAFGWHGIFVAASLFALVSMLVNWTLVCSCGHPLPAQMRGPLFRPRPTFSSAGRTDREG